ncbi:MULTISPECIES: SGNH/GDSL hydrolase family protein [unclassified Roseovarius]|uniref:SGNH/GDSL hydrolase family protein n=1 Tax=unclassified Roseovarius TaxID=2614913 RepID=UPI00273FE0CC|nr:MULTISPECIES: SGNH/GDSL hydrolase family protein [unclassified Roseovarius]
MDLKHLVLAGDSIFDNDGYVLGEAGVIEQLRCALPSTCSASKVAVDGDCIKHVKDQIADLPSNATDLIVSVGGNDARFHSALLSKVKHSNDLDALLSAPLDEFASDYRRMLDTAKATGLRLYVCTIYTAVPFEDPVWRQFVPLAINKFNEVIIAEAGAYGVPVLHLQDVCTETSDFSTVSPIEPSNQGGQKIVNLIVERVVGPRSA